MASSNPIWNMVNSVIQNLQNALFDCVCFSDWANDIESPSWRLENEFAKISFCLLLLMVYSDDDDEWRDIVVEDNVAGEFFLFVWDAVFDGDETFSVLIFKFKSKF